MRNGIQLHMKLLMSLSAIAVVGAGAASIEPASAGSVGSNGHYFSDDSSRSKSNRSSRSSSRDRNDSERGDNRETAFNTKGGKDGKGNDGWRDSGRDNDWSPNFKPDDPFDDDIPRHAINHDSKRKDDGRDGKGPERKWALGVSFSHDKHKHKKHRRKKKHDHPSEVPLPGALPLMASVLGGGFFLRRWRSYRGRNSSDQTA